MSMSNYLENLVLNATLRHNAFTPPATYIGLFTACSGDGVYVTEVVGASYARQSGVFYAPDASGMCSNSGVIQFSEATTAWGTITHGGIYDVGTSGNLLYWATINSNRTIASGDTFQIPDRGFRITLD